MRARTDKSELVNERRTAAPSHCIGRDIFAKLSGLAFPTQTQSIQTPLASGRLIAPTILNGVGLPTFWQVKEKLSNGLTPSPEESGAPGRHARMDERTECFLVIQNGAGA